MNRVILFIAIIFAYNASYGEVLIGKDQYLYVPKSDNRRLLLEPGSILLRKPIPNEEVFKKRVRVISSGGVEGEVKLRDIDSVNDMTGMLAYVKDEIDIKGNKYPIGTVFPMKIIDDEDDLVYEITYTRSSYSVKRNGFIMKEKTATYQEHDFLGSFNLIDATEVTHYKFPFWIRDTRHSPTEWGCGESKEMTKTLDANAGASVEASGGFFGFFQAKAEASAGASTSTIYKKILKDDSFKHRVTYWSLTSAINNENRIIDIALEKISICDNSRGVDNSYIIRFEKKKNLDEITINSAWVAENQFKKGGGSPLRIDSQSDLQQFENALKDFKFTHTVDGYDIKRAIIDFSIMLTVNLNYAPQN